MINCYSSVKTTFKKEKIVMKTFNIISNLTSLISCTNGSGFGTFNSRRGNDTGSGFVDVKTT